ncbi:hypothetical protein ACLHQ1_004840, partial [Escherichia coli]
PKCTANNAGWNDKAVQEIVRIPELILDGYSESSYSATPRFAAARLPWFKSRLIKIIRLP